MQEKHLKMVLSKEKIFEIESYCSKDYVGEQKEGCLFDKEVVFDDGVRMAIQVCYVRGEPCWTQGVLFLADGTEVACTDVGDFFKDTYTLDHDDVIYYVEVCSD